MSEGSLSILDGAQLRTLDLSPPPGTAETGGSTTGAAVLDLAESSASASLHGVVLPESLKSAALRRIGVTDAAAFRSTQLDCEEAAKMLRSYVSAIADELADDPVVVAILDGRILRMFLEDEDDFAMLAENLFTDLDTEDRGKISNNEINNALVHMGIEMGIPPVTEFPQLSDILERHKSETVEELGQAQFAQLLQPVLQELADALTKKHVVLVQNIEIANGSKLRKLLTSNDQLDGIVRKLMQEEHDTEPTEKITVIIRRFLEKNAKELGLPPSEVDDTVMLYNEIFSEVESQKNLASGSEEIILLLKGILEKLSEKLEASPVLYDPQN